MKIQLLPFDQEFLETIEGHENIVIDKAGVYHVFSVDSEPAGVVGFLPLQDRQSEGRQGFVQIVISNTYRGKGLVQKAEDLLAQEYDLIVLYATIDEKNKASIQAHLKAGFELENPGKVEWLKQSGKLKKNQTRLKKDYY